LLLHRRRGHRSRRYRASLAPPRWCVFTRELSKRPDFRGLQLWGLLKESFAGGTELAKAKMDPRIDALIKAVVDDFGTAEGRSITRDGLKNKLTGTNPADVKESASKFCGKPRP
jgi:hypothetical protein